MSASSRANGNAAEKLLNLKWRTRRVPSPTRHSSETCERRSASSSAVNGGVVLLQATHRCAVRSAMESVEKVRLGADDPVVQRLEAEPSGNARADDVVRGH